MVAWWRGSPARMRSGQPGMQPLPIYIVLPTKRPEVHYRVICIYSAKPRALSVTTAITAVVEDLLPSEHTLRTPTMSERWAVTHLTVMRVPWSRHCCCDGCSTQYEEAIRPVMRTIACYLFSRSYENEEAPLFE